MTVGICTIHVKMCSSMTACIVLLYITDGEANYLSPAAVVPMNYTLVPSGLKVIEASLFYIFV